MPDQEQEAYDDLEEDENEAPEIDGEPVTPQSIEDDADQEQTEITESEESQEPMVKCRLFDYAFF